MKIAWGKASIDLKGPTNLQTRGMLANLAPVAAAAILMVLIGLIASKDWPEETARQRLEGLIWLAIFMAALMGLGMFYLWQLLVKKIDVQGPGGFKAGIEVAEDSDQSEHGVAPTAAETMKDLQESQ